MFFPLLTRAHYILLLLSLSRVRTASSFSRAPPLPPLLPPPPRPPLPLSLAHSLLLCLSRAHSLLFLLHFLCLGARPLSPPLPPPLSLALSRPLSRPIRPTRTRPSPSSHESHRPFSPSSTRALRHARPFLALALPRHSSLSLFRSLKRLSPAPSSPRQPRLFPPLSLHTLPQPTLSRSLVPAPAPAPRPPAAHCIALPRSRRRVSYHVQAGRSRGAALPVAVAVHAVVLTDILRLVLVAADAVLFVDLGP